MHDQGNVTEVVPMFAVASMEASLHYYVDGLGFSVARAPDIRAGGGEDEVR